MLIAEAVDVLPVKLCVEGVITVRDASVVELVVAVRILDLGAKKGLERSYAVAPSFSDDGKSTDPKVNLEIPTSSKLPVTDLKGHRHSVALMELFVKAFPRMRS